MQEMSTQYTMWCFAGNDRKESIEFKLDELSVDEESARSVKWGIDGVTGSVRPGTDPKGDVKKEKTFEYEVKWHFKLIEAIVWVEKDILIKMSVRRRWLASRPSCSCSLVLRNILVISVLTPSPPVTRRSTS